MLGSVAFLFVFIVLAAAIIPERFEYGRELLAEYDSSQCLYDYIDIKMQDLEIVTFMATGEDQLYTAYQKSEGITFFSMSTLMSFDTIKA